MHSLVRSFDVGEDHLCVHRSITAVLSFSDKRCRFIHMILFTSVKYHISVDWKCRDNYAVTFEKIIGN